MRLLLDEMWPPRAALELTKRGHECEAVAARLDLRGRPDEVITEVAVAEQRWIVTENVRDFRRIAAKRTTSGQAPPNLIFTGAKLLTAPDGRRSIGRLVRGIEAISSLLLEEAGGEYWL